MSANTIESVIESRVFGATGPAAVVKVGSSRLLTSIEIARLVHKGMSGAYLQRLCLRIPRQVLADTLGAEVSNFSKFYKRTLSKVQTDEINDLTLVWSELRDFFDNDDALINEWLKTPSPALSGAEPMELLSTIVGRQTLRKNLDAMRYGEFA
jgi:putative toxin-antitoxin system antitoxin component (TIGR02293 family)